MLRIDVSARRPPLPAPARNRPAGWGCVAAAVFATWLPAVGCAPPGGIRITPVPVDQSLEETEVYRDDGWVTDKIALIDLDGVLVNDTPSGLFESGEHPVSFLVEKLRAAEADATVKAVVLRINSPGGTVTASDLMHHELLAFRERTGKPVVAFLMDVAASGGYYVACSANVILACPTTVTGSIGVIMQTVEVTGTLEKLGVTTDAITTGPHKDSGSPLRKMRPEERTLFQNLINQMYERFIKIVREGRPLLSEAKIRTLADGRVYLAPLALEAGLIDGIAPFEDAIATARTLAKSHRVRVVRYHRPLGWQPTWYAGSPVPPAEAAAASWVARAARLFTSGPTFLYLWRIGM